MNNRFFKPLIAMGSALVLVVSCFSGITFESKASDYTTYSFHDLGIESKKYENEINNIAINPEGFSFQSGVRLEGIITFSSSNAQETVLCIAGNSQMESIGIAYEEGDIVILNYRQYMGHASRIIGRITPQDAGTKLGDTPLRMAFVFNGQPDSMCGEMDIFIGDTKVKSGLAYTVGNTIQIKSKEGQYIRIMGCELEHHGADCLGTGIREHWKCTGTINGEPCGKYYKDALGVAEVPQEYTVKEVGHTKAPFAEKASYGKEGKIGGSRCVDCSEVFSTPTTVAAPTTMTATSLKYTGKTQKTTVVVKDSKGATIPSTEYTVSGNSVKNVGTYTAKVTFNSTSKKYTGTMTKTYVVNPPTTGITSISTGTSKPVVKWSKKTAGVTGYELEYATNSSFKSAKKVKITKDTTTSKAISMSAGKKYYVRIRTYSGSLVSAWSSAKYTYTPSTTSVKSVKAGSKKVTVKWTKKSTYVTGYEIQYSTSSSFKSPKTVKISKNKTTSKTISKLKAKKKYYVRIRTYYKKSGKTYTSAWSSKKYATTKK